MQWKEEADNQLRMPKARVTATGGNTTKRRVESPILRSCKVIFTIRKRRKGKKEAAKFPLRPGGNPNSDFYGG